jgi:hypothetical protein
MLAHLAERIEALGPRFRLPLQTIVAVEAQAGRRAALAFAREHHDMHVKVVCALLADVVVGANLLTEYVNVSSEWRPNARKTKRLRRRLDKALAAAKARIED